jgi:hypothetical protein
MTSVPSVRVGPGLTALTRTPFGPNSAAHALVSRVSAALLEPYRAMPATPKWATMVSTLMTEPWPRVAMAGASSPALLTRMSTWPPPSSAARRGQRPHRGGVGQVRGDEVGLPAVRADLRDHRVTAGSIPAADQDVRAAAGQHQGGGPADAAGRAGYQGGRPGQVGGCHLVPFPR